MTTTDPSAIPEFIFRERREFSAVDPRGQVTGLSALLECGHWAEFVSEASSDWDFPDEAHPCSECGTFRHYHPAVVEHLRRLA